MTVIWWHGAGLSTGDCLCSPHTLADALTGPEDARQKMRTIAKGRTGVILGNAANAPVAFLPLTVEQMTTLRDGERARVLFGAVAKANASSAILCFDDRAQSNTAKTLNPREVTVLDASTGEAAAYLPAWPKEVRCEKVETGCL